VVAEQLRESFPRFNTVGPPLLLDAGSRLRLLIRLRCGLLLLLRLIRLLILNRLRCDRRHLIGIVDRRRVGDGRQRDRLIAGRGLRLGLQVEIRLAAGLNRAAVILGREQNADNYQQRPGNDAAAVHRR